MTSTPHPQVIIIGAGPAGLTAALELARNSDIRPIIIESLDQVGGISRTINHNGNRMDIGGHRFFSKSDWVMNWWKEVLPVALKPGAASEAQSIGYMPADDQVMLIRSRLSRIYYLRRFFDYPISLSVQTMRNLGVFRLFKIGLSYTKTRITPLRKENNLEDFFINRFGKVLYRTFFKDYTEKVWGVPCNEISAAWGAQRIKGLSITGALLHALGKIFRKSNDSVAQKNIETSLIEKFLYPKYGPGQMWETVAKRIDTLGGKIFLDHDVYEICHEDNNIVAVKVRNKKTGEERQIPCDHIISSMPVKDLINALTPSPPEDVKSVAKGLLYRDFITVGILARKLRASPHSASSHSESLIRDNWIYIQEPDVKIGRLQIFNNWSPAMVSSTDMVWLGLEYFCTEGDALWQLCDADMADLAKSELDKIGLLDATDVIDYKVIRVPKAYPAYFGSYDRFDTISQFTDCLDNLYLVGRNGMHRYNNQDHSMLTAKLAADRILGHGKGMDEIWTVNIEEEYHEKKQQ